MKVSKKSVTLCSKSLDFTQFLRIIKKIKKFFKKVLTNAFYCVIILNADERKRYASVAQLVEQGTENPRVVGSIPTGGTTYADLAHLVERDLAKVEVAGSSPVIRSIRLVRKTFCTMSFIIRL